MEHQGEAAVRDAGAEAVTAGLEAARKDVLDLSLRNPLLNFRPSKRLGLRVVGELSREVFRTLAGSGRGRTMYFRPSPIGPIVRDATHPRWSLSHQLVRSRLAAAIGYESLPGREARRARGTSRLACPPLLGPCLVSAPPQQSPTRPSP